MDIDHDVRNWLHRLVMALQAADTSSVVQAFSEEAFERVEGPTDGACWEDRTAWADFVESELGRLRPGELYLRMLGRPAIQHGSDGEPLRLRWQVAIRPPGTRDAPSIADCEATLHHNGERWVASSLQVRTGQSPE